MGNKTKQKLLESALDIFAEEGFKSATVQQIVGRAGANVSAINYHFGNKANFYAEAVVHHIKKPCQMPPWNPNLKIAQRSNCAPLFPNA